MTTPVASTLLLCAGGFAPFTFTVQVGDAEPVDMTFATLNAAQSYFDDALVPLGTAASAASLTVTLTFTATGTTATTGFAEELVVGIACFAAGTCLATPAGEVAVEHLREGGLVLTPDGPRPIVWIGRRHIDLRTFADPEAARPVRIAPHAFAPNAPSRALLLSPDHAVFANGVLIPIRHLLNATTVRQLSPDEITYYHVELATHGVVFANALPAESYLDTGNRAMFAAPALQAA